MSQLDTARRDALPPRSFAYVDSLGGEHLPIHDAAHVRVGHRLADRPLRTAGGGCEYGTI